MRTRFWVILAALLACLCLPLVASAQTPPLDPRILGEISGDEDDVRIENLPPGRGTAAISIVDFCMCTLVIEGRVGATWNPIDGAPTIDGDGVYSVSAAGLDAIRVRASAWASITTGIGIRVSSAGGGSGGSGGGGAGGDVTIVQGGNTAVVNASGELTVSCGDCTGTGVSAPDDSAFAVTMDDVVPIGAMFSAVGVDSIDEDDVGVVRMSANRNLYVQLRDAAGNERGLNIDANGAIAVTATNLDIQSGGVDVASQATLASLLTSSQLVDDAVSGTGFNISQLAGAAIPMLTTQADNVVNTTDALAVSAFLHVFDGSAFDRAPGTSTDGLLVNLGANNDVTVTSGSITANAGTNLNTSALLTTTAHDNSFGTAGTPDAQVRTVQGVTNGTPLEVTGPVGVGTTPHSFLQTAGAVYTDEVIATPALAWGLQCFNVDSGEAYVRLYDQTGNPGTGDTANIKFRGVIPPNTSGFLVMMPNAMTFGTGVGIRVSGAIADNDNTALTANTVMCNLQLGAVP